MLTLFDIYKRNGIVEKTSFSTRELSSFVFPKDADASHRNPNLRKAIFEVFGGRCVATGAPLSLKNMTIDHVIPRSKGGPDNIFNYALMSSPINNKKGDVLHPDNAPLLLASTRKRAQEVLRIFKNCKSL